jgi:flagellin
MGFTINTNIAAMNAHTNAMMNNREIDKSLGKLSSGLRINTAADDASGLSIADSLRSQASSLGQAVSNANDGISIIQIADKAMDEQTKILDTIKTKATQAAQDGQSADSRKALQADITKLMEELDNIAGTTSFNGQSLLSGQFTNKEFQIGAYSNQSVKASIGATSSDKIGNARFETTQNIATAGSAKLTFKNVDGTNDITLEAVKISTSAGTGIGVLAETINKNSNLLGGIQASFSVVTTGSAAVITGTITSLKINGTSIGDIAVKDANDSKGVLVAAINNFTSDTGVTASIDSRGRLSLTSNDGRAIKISAVSMSASGLAKTGNFNAGRLTLTRTGAADIFVSAGSAIKFSSSAQATVNLRGIKDSTSKDNASAMGFNANTYAVNISTSKTAGVTTLKGAMGVMTIADAALKQLDKVRSDLGSVQNQLVSTVNNISVTQVNVKAAESQIRDVDFASESANFSKHNILAQSGSYAMSQANAVQQNVLKLLQ